MLSRGSTTAMCLLVMMMWALRALGTMTSGLILMMLGVFVIIRLGLGLMLVDTLVGQRIYHEVVHLLGLGRGYLPAS
jgi:hypothetical protein